LSLHSDVGSWVDNIIDCDTDEGWSVNDARNDGTFVNTVEDGWTDGRDVRV